MRRCWSTITVASEANASSSATSSVVAAVEIPRESWDRRIWVFNDCEKPEGTPTKSTLTNTIGKRTRTTVQETTSNAELPPLGWCWI